MEANYLGSVVVKKQDGVFPHTALQDLAYSAASLVPLEEVKVVLPGSPPEPLKIYVKRNARHSR